MGGVPSLYGQDVSSTSFGRYHLTTFSESRASTSPYHASYVTDLWHDSQRPGFAWARYPGIWARHETHTWAPPGSSFVLRRRRISPPLAALTPMGCASSM